MTTVTTALKESIKEVTGRPVTQITYSDPRKHKKAVGVKIATFYPQVQIDKIIEKMKKRGFKLAYVRKNLTPPPPPVGDLTTRFYHTLEGTRFCFYKK